MNILGKIVEALKFTATQPKSFGIYHLCCVAAVIVITVLMCIFLRKINDKTFRIIVGSLWIVMVLFEIYKQFVFNYKPNTGWDYDWAWFPFQLCSTPLYVLPILAFFKDGKIRDAAIFYIGTFSLFGGLVVYIFPNDVFGTNILGINIQTMVHHGIQVILGIYVPVYFLKKFSWKNYLFASAFFWVLLLIALALNLIIGPRVDNAFNMFYIGPYHACHLPILSAIYPKVPFVAFFFIYGLGFCFVALILYLIPWGIKKLVDLIKGKKANKQNA